MKYCPTCQTRYDEEILRFCMKDGTPLIDEAAPNFTEMPSESIQAEDDPGEVTVIRQKGQIPIPPPVMDEAGEFEPPEPEYRPSEPEYRPKEEPPPRIVVPMEQPPRPQARVIPPYQPPPRKTNTFLVVLLTMSGTVALLGAGALGFWLLSGGTAANTNANANNANANVNVNTNLGYDTNFNFGNNSNSSLNTNTNTNANVKSPTPTPTPKPSPSVTPSPSPTPDDDETPTPTPRPPVNTNTRPSPTPPRMLPTNRNTNRPGNGT